MSAAGKPPAVLLNLSIMKNFFHSALLIVSIGIIVPFTINKASAQVSFDICIPSSWVGGGSGEITLFNNSGNALPAGSTLEINWPGIISISPWSGFTVSGSNPFILTFTNPVPAGSSIGPLGFSFTSNGSYFAPSMGILNTSETALLADPPCYVPPSYQNFDCETQFSELCFVHPNSNGLPGEIRIGEGMVRSWNADLNAYIPTNRKNWALGMAVAHSMFTNLVGFDAMSINEYFATGIQETNCGCDGGITTPGWVTNPYPNHEATSPVFCFDYTHGVAVGFFQEEYGTGWLELNQDIPCFIPTFNFDSTIVGKNFSAQLIGKVYHDYNNLMFLQYIKCFKVLEFIQNCSDPYGGEKLIAAIYNRGMNAGFIEDILVTNRTAALAAPDLLTFIPGLGQQYAEQISRVTAVLDNNLGAVSAFGTSTYAVPWPGSHNHNGFYDTQVSWADVSDYLNELELMYNGVGVNMTNVKNTVQPIFDGINSGNSISFRYDFGAVADAIVLALPAFEAMPGLGQVYGNSGGNSCSFPTARLEESIDICPDDSVNLEVFLTGTGPWDFTYNFNGTDYTVSNITSSPYILTVSSPGLYYLTYVEDGTNTPGKAICDSVNIGIIDTCQVVALPVELMDFQATAISSNLVRANWSTYSELNNSHFNVQRSTSTINWETIGTVQSNGNSNELLHYFYDDDDRPHRGTSYYRLEIVDIDGTLTYSPVRSVYIDDNTIGVYPNPTDGMLTLQGNLKQLKEFEFINVLGQDVTHQTTIIEQQNSLIRLDLSKLSSGLYTLRIGNVDMKISKY